MRLVLAALLFLSTSAHGAENLEVRGISLGDTVEQVKAAHPDAECKPVDTLISESVCTVRGFGAAADAFVFYYVVGDKVESVSVTFDQSKFELVLRALQSKFGEPVDEKTTLVQNQMGAQFPSKEVNWFDRGKQAALTLRERSGQVDRSAVDLRDRAGMQALKARLESKTRDAVDAL